MWAKCRCHEPTYIGAFGIGVQRCPMVSNQSPQNKRTETAPKEEHAFVRLEDWTHSRFSSEESGNQVSEAYHPIQITSPRPIPYAYTSIGSNFRCLNPWCLAQASKLDIKPQRIVDDTALGDQYLQVDTPTTWGNSFVDWVATRSHCWLIVGWLLARPTKDDLSKPQDSKNSQPTINPYSIPPKPANFTPMICLS